MSWTLFQKIKNWVNKNLNCRTIKFSVVKLDDITHDNRFLIRAFFLKQSIIARFTSVISLFGVFRETLLEWRMWREPTILLCLRQRRQDYFWRVRCNLTLRPNSTKTSVILSFLMQIFFGKAPFLVSIFLICLFSFLFLIHFCLNPFSDSFLFWYFCDGCEWKMSAETFRLTF